jgi:hypothetical protein
MEDNEEVLRDGPPPLDCREICRTIGIDLRLKGLMSLSGMVEIPRL